MKLRLYVLLLFVFVPVRAMYFNIEDQQYHLVQRTKEKDHVGVNIPLKECAICFEDKHLVGSVPCVEGDKHPDICDDCMHRLVETKHACKGTCPFCRRDLLRSHNLACSICKEKFKSTQQSSTDVGCCACFIIAYKVIRSWFN